MFKDNFDVPALDANMFILLFPFLAGGHTLPFITQMYFEGHVSSVTFKTDPIWG